MFDITQGKYWKRKMATILAEYKKWRLTIISLHHYDYLVKSLCLNTIITIDIIIAGYFTKIKTTSNAQTFSRTDFLTRYKRLLAL